MASLPHVNEIPVALVTLGISLAGVLFTLGYFLALDSNYLSLFELKDHLVFALTGAMWVLLILLAFSVPTILFLVIAKSNLTARRTVLLGLTLIILAFLAWHAMLINARYGPYYAALRLILIALYALIQFAIFSDRLREYRMAAIIFAITIAATYTGTYVGSLAARGSDFKNTYVELNDNTIHRVVRAGTQWILGVDRNRELVAVKSSNVKRIFTSTRMPLVPPSQ